MSSESSVESVKEEQECEDNFIIETKTTKKFKCMYCNKKYRQNAGRYNHMKRVHGLIVMERVAVSCQELGCKYVCGSKEKLQKHLQKVHNKEMTVLTLEFNSISEFDSWKDEFEKREKCRFVKKSGSRMTEDGFKLCYYYCSRSGTFISHSRGLKKKSSKGTSKSSVHCTASITVTEAQNGMVQVKVCATHYGHSVDLRHLRLTKYDKSNIADQIARGVPREIVLDKIRASAGSDIDRIHLVTMKDIKNIEKAFGVQSSELKRVQHSGMKNLDSWVSGMKSFENDSMIVFYKNDLISSSGGYSAGGDVCLILMTTGQYEIFKKFCNDGIFYLPVLTIKNNFNMNLFTLMVVDDVNEVIPVTFMISNRKDEDVVKFFFQKIKYKLGSFVSKALITDNEEILHTAWCTVFNEETQHFWSTRYVDSNWREMLLSVKNEELQCSIYETLYSFLEQKSDSIFESKVENLLSTILNNGLTQQFGMLFKTKYSNTKKLWAGCYGKKDVGINVHLNLDTIYNELMSICNCRGKFAKFFDKTIQGLLKVVSDRQCQRTNKIFKQTQDMALHHSMAENIKDESINLEDENQWRVNTTKNPEKFLFKIKENEKSCSQPSSCQLYCAKCRICAHNLKCSCCVYEFDNTMCKHIHAVGLWQSRRRLEEEDSNLEENANDCSMDYLVKQVLIETSALQTDVVAFIENVKKDVTDEIVMDEDENLESVKQRLYKKSIEQKANTVQSQKRKRGRPKKSETVDSQNKVNVDPKDIKDGKKTLNDIITFQSNINENLRRSERPKKKNPFLPNILRR